MMQGARLVDTLAEIEENKAYSSVEIQKQILGSDMLKALLRLFIDPEEEDNQGKVFFLVSWSQSLSPFFR